MPLTLHDAFVPTSLQLLRAIAAVLDKAEAHCAANGIEPEELIGARLAPDMKDFAYQVKSCLVHSAIAVESCMTGTASPDWSEPPRTFSGLRTLLTDAASRLERRSTEEMEALLGQPLLFSVPGWGELSFTADQFLLSFSQPNLFFHATTAYDLLRWKGVPLGKGDYLGTLRVAG